MTLDEALNILKLDSPFNLIQLKTAYRDLIKIWHPDKNPDCQSEATAVTQSLNTAYDLLEACTSVKAGDGQLWTKYLAENLPKWEAEFKQGWLKTYKRSRFQEKYAGLHLNTFTTTFRRSRLEPRPDWYKNVLFPHDRPSDRLKYREHLLAIAPNQRLQEAWARKYFMLEFGESSWVFYLAPQRELAASKN